MQNLFYGGNDRRGIQLFEAPAPL